MIETANPEVNVHELMERVRREAAKARQQGNGHSPAPAAQPVATTLPPLPDIPTPPGLGSSGPLEVKKVRLDAMLKQARASTEVSSGIPKFLRGFFRKQGGYNRALLETVASLAKTNVQLNKRVQELQLAAQQQNDWIRILIDHRAADTAWMRAATPIISSFGAWQERVTHLEERLAALGASAHGRLEQHEAQLQQLGGQLQQHGSQFEQYEAQLQQLGGQLQQHGADLQQHSLRIDQNGQRIMELVSQGERSGEHLRNLQTETEVYAQRLQDYQSNNERIAEHLRNLQSQADGSGEHLRNLQRTADHLLAIHDQNERAAEHLRNLQVQVDRQAEHLRDLQEQEERQNTHLRNLQDTATASGEHLRNLQDETDRAAEQAKDVAPLKVTSARLEAEVEQLANLRLTLGRLEERQTNDAIYLKAQISQHSTLLQQWLTSGGKKKGAAPAPAATTPALPSGALDEFYVTFENRFRGARSEIKERVRFYLPLLRKAKAGTAPRPILDLGCGRGEWLELLAENNLTASGVDLNAAMVQQCVERDLNAVHADAIEHLRSLPANSQGGVSGFHIIEHLPFEVLLQLFMQTLRALKPGGIAIFESPNCKNLSVGACYFNVDPTHRNPVFPETAGFIMETQGFEDVQLEYLAPADRRLTNGDPDAEFLNDLLFGPQDFAVIGRKPRQR